MDYKVTFIDSYGMELGHREFKETYYKSRNSIRDTIIAELNSAKYDDLVPIRGGAIRKYSIDMFTVTEEVSE